MTQPTQHAGAGLPSAPITSAPALILPHGVQMPGAAAVTIAPPAAPTPGPTTPTPPATPDAPQSATASILMGSHAILDAIEQDAAAHIRDEHSFGTSVLAWLKRFLVPVGTIMDITSASLRFLTLGFLLVLPDLYNLIFSPPAGSVLWGIVHYVVLGSSIAGIALGVPVALFSSVFSLVNLMQKAEAVHYITDKRMKKDRRLFFEQKIKYAWRYIAAAFFAGVAISIPFFLPGSTGMVKQIISEAVFIIVPFVCSAVTIITERESGSDIQERSANLGGNVALYSVFGAGKRLAVGHGTMRDVASVNHAMNGNLRGAMEASVDDPGDVQYLTLAQIAALLHLDTDKGSADRRRLSNIARQAFDTGRYGIRKDPKRGYLIPDDKYHRLFGHLNGGTEVETGWKTSAPRLRSRHVSGRREVETWSNNPPTSPADPPHGGAGAGGEPSHGRPSLVVMPGSGQETADDQSVASA